jgi:predicted ribosome quality control (RQC) complex YloA/Tae2 family protein
VRARIDGLRTILRAEIRRAWNAEERTAEDLAGFADPDRFRIWGEALLAGLSSARRVGEHALVPDPYDPEAREIAVPADPSRTLASAAEEHFRRHRRSRRGIESARRRLDSLRSRRERLERLGVIHESATSMADGERFAEAMRAEGIPVGLEPATRAARIAARTREPRLEGVRLYVASEGTEILVGRSGRDNARLTFRLAGPEDFWLHAAGVPGAHVVVRNPRREARPALRTLEEAASLAAWFSDARDADLVDVHWTRRKHVRRVRGAPPGTVTLKRFESIRIRPAMPAGSEASGES